MGKPAVNDLRSGLATAPTLYAAEEFPELLPLIQRRFKEVRGRAGGRRCCLQGAGEGPIAAMGSAAAPQQGMCGRAQARVPSPCYHPHACLRVHCPHPPHVYAGGRCRGG